MNPEGCGKESETSNRQSKASHPARKHACFCPPTMHDIKLDQLNKARVKEYSKYCQGRAHAKLLNQHVFKPYIWPSHLGLSFLFFFLGYRGDVHPLPAKHRQRHRTNLICAGTTA